MDVDNRQYEHEAALPNVNVNDAPFTPISFCALLCEQFQLYTEEKLPDFLKTKAKGAPELAIQGGEGEAGGIKARFWAFKSFAMDKMREQSRKFATHTSVFKFVLAEMRDIMEQSQDLSPIKKMADLTILFHAFHCYIATETHSKELLPLLDSVNEALWACTPAVAFNREFGPQVQVGGASNAGDQKQIKDIDSNYQLYIETQEKKLGFKRPHRSEFLNRYTAQIQAAFGMISCNTTDAAQAIFFANPSQKFAYQFITDRASFCKDDNGQPSLYYYRAQFRTKDPRDYRNAREFSNDFKEANIRLQNQNASEIDLHRACAKLQFTMEFTMPTASMGPAYDSFLADILLDQYNFVVEDWSDELYMASKELRDQEFQQAWGDPEPDSEANRSPRW